MALVSAAIGFVGLAALSYWNPMLAVGAVLAWSAIVIVRWPVIGWALTIFAVPLQNLFALSSADFGRIRAILLLLLMVRMLSLAAKRQTYRSPMLWFLLAFGVLVWAHDIALGSSVMLLARDIVFFLALGAVYVISREFCAQARGMALAHAAIILSALVSAAFTALFLYVPLPDLIFYHQSLDNLRLFGVQDNPNALAKFLMLALLLLVCVAIFKPHLGRRAIPLVFVTASLLAATSTRSVVVALAATLFVLFPLLNRRFGRASSFWAILSLVVLGYTAWMLGAAPWVERHAAEQWTAHEEWGLCYYLSDASSAHNPCGLQGPAVQRTAPHVLGQIWSAVAKELRMRGSYAMRKVNDKTVYDRRAFSPWQIGQRDRTWDGGLKVVAAHWAWGIGGPKQWAQFMQEILDYPFDSPHNALLEVTGGYGVLGLLLYLSVVGFFIRNYLSMRTLAREPWQRLANEWTFLAGVAVFVVEMTDVLTVFGITIHAIWFWVIAGLQAGLRDNVLTTGQGLAGRDPQHSVVGPTVGAREWQGAVGGNAKG
jgi:hypothetical protein